MEQVRSMTQWDQSEKMEQISSITSWNQSDPQEHFIRGLLLGTVPKISGFLTPSLPLFMFVLSGKTPLFVDIEIWPECPPPCMLSLSISISYEV